VKFKHLRCKCETKSGRICHAFLGNIESDKEVTVQLPCRYSKGHRNTNHLSEFTQDSVGNLTVREVPAAETVEYDDNMVRVQNG
jgi:hypothetical protein